jgi:hypothetical protein
MDLCTWLEHIPREESEAIANDLNLAGLLLPEMQGEVRVVAGPFCFAFDKEDVLKVEAIESPQGSLPVGAAPVRIWLREGVRLKRLTSSEHYVAAMWRSRTPFAISARRKVVPLPEYPRYRAMEREFLRQLGIEQNDPDSLQPG